MKRPKIVTLICVLGFLSIVFSFPQVFSPSVKKLGVWMPALFGILVAASFISYVGLWFYKKWGLHLFLISYFSKTILSLVTEDIGFGFYFSQFFSILFIVILLRLYPKMDNNL